MIGSYWKMQPIKTALLCRFGCYALFSAESGLLFVKLFKAWQDLRGLVYWETVWSEGLTAILGLSLIACVLLAWSDAQSRQCWTSHWERECVYWRTVREVYHTATGKHTAETQSISTRWLIPCFSFSPSSTHKISSRGALQSTLTSEDYNQARCFLTVNIWPWKIFPVSVFLLIVIAAHCGVDTHWRPPPAPSACCRAPEDQAALRRSSSSLQPPCSQTCPSRSGQC